MFMFTSKTKEELNTNGATVLTVIFSVTLS